MSASFSSTPYDTLKVLPVTKQTALVTNPISQIAKSFNPATLMRAVRSNPRNVIDIVHRLHSLKTAAPLIGLAALIKPLHLDALCAQHSGPGAFKDRLGNGIGDRGLINLMCAEELLNLAKLMQGRKHHNLLDYTANNGVLYKYAGRSSQYQTVSGINDVLKATKPNSASKHSDIAAKVGFAALLIGAASKIGASHVVSDAVSDAPTPWAQRSLLNTATRHSLDNGDFRTLGVLSSEPSFNFSGAAIDSGYPTWKNDLSGNFKFDEDTNPNAVPGIRDDFKTTMNTLNPSPKPWHYTPDDDGLIPEDGPDLGLIQGMSPDARSMFKDDADLGTPNAIADNYPPSTLSDLHRSSGSGFSGLFDGGSKRSPLLGHSSSGNVLDQLDKDTANNKQVAFGYGKSNISPAEWDQAAKQPEYGSY